MSAPTAAAAPAPEPEQGPWAGKLPATPRLDFTSILPERSAEHVLAAEIHITLGRKAPVEYVLPVLSIAENREWKASLEGRLVSLLSTLDDVGDDLGGVLAAFATVTDELLDMLYSYDADGLLPPRPALERDATDAQVLRAVLEVWSAANPFAQVAVAALREAEPGLATAVRKTSGSSRHTSTSRPPTGGRRATSRPS